jgi:hypothetical protein
MKWKMREWNQCWEEVMEAGEWSLHEEDEEGVELMLGVVMEAGEWSLHEEEEEGVESMLGGGDGSRRFPPLDEDEEEGEESMLGGDDGSRRVVFA